MGSARSSRSANNLMEDVCTVLNGSERTVAKLALPHANALAYLRSVELFPFQVSLLRKVRVSTEMSLYVLAYNMKRVIKLLVRNG
ncbi:hypothetical protein BN2476_1090030 [Paraburkholderia piptadeniae]|uniref:Transposase n=1 Tax=Paraburkholderia piptadeniae TaxID=1701573 RepID=A0A1N7SUS5_9BURK|nr:hypothetical protein BN2476_1090030 [Paraburkholderia piptadeniae]